MNTIYKPRKGHCSMCKHMEEECNLPFHTMPYIRSYRTIEGNTEIDVACTALEERTLGEKNDRD